MHTHVNMAKMTVLICSLYGFSSTTVPTDAFALGWNAKDEGVAIGVTEPKADTYTTVASSITRSFTNYAFGVAIVIFTLRVVLTALDRMVLTNTNGDKVLRLSDIPIIGAYPDPVDQEMYADERDGDKKQQASSWTWSHIWRHFAIQIAIVSGIWAFIGILLGILEGTLQITGISTSA